MMTPRVPCSSRRSSSCACARPHWTRGGVRTSRMSIAITRAQAAQGQKQLRRADAAHARIWADAQARCGAPAAASGRSQLRQRNRATRDGGRAKALVRTAPATRSRLGEGESRKGPAGTMLTSAFAESTRARRSAAAAYPGADGGRLLAVDGMRPHRVRWDHERGRLMPSESGSAARAMQQRVGCNSARRWQSSPRSDQAE
jgi:hypothetical protein